MNRQPFCTPPRSWPPKLSPWIVRLWRPWINRALRRQQRIAQIDVEGDEHLRGVLGEGCGVLVTPNHSFHYDSYVLIETAHRVGRPFHFLCAWQVFAMSKPWERWVLQKHGCYSINREANDLQAFKQSVEILRTGSHPLVIFPEGDIYHSNDRVTPFRDGAAAIALAAAKKAERKVVAVPCAVKAFYLDDPTADFDRLLGRLERALFWRPDSAAPLSARVVRVAAGVLALKEIEYLGEPQGGTLAERVARLTQSILGRLEAAHGVRVTSGHVPERVKELRRTVIERLEQPDLKEPDRQRLESELDDLFLVVQLFSYPVDYLAQQPSVERIAETLDKFEEDVLQADYPAVRGTRRVVVRFGEPLEAPKQRQGRDAVGAWTDALESRVQGLLDQVNAAHAEGFR